MTKTAANPKARARSAPPAAPPRHRGYAVIIDARADRVLTEKQADMLTISLRGSSIACDSVTGYLRFALHVDAASMLGAVTEALRVTERAARVEGFGYEAEELRVLPSARLEAETMRLLAPLRPAGSDEGSGIPNVEAGP
jgi:hypothetical protein